MIEKKMKNGRVVTVSDIHIETVHNRVMVIEKEIIAKAYDDFTYPVCQWGGNRPAIVKRDFTILAKGILPQYFISIWLTSTPKKNSKFSSNLIISFFADMNNDSSIIKLIEENLPDIDSVFEEYSVDYDL